MADNGSYGTYVNGNGRESENILFTNVRILDGTGQLPYTGSVLVEGRRIRAVGRSTAPIAAPGGATVIDGAGATLMPGMCEAHTHFSWNDAATLAGIRDAINAQAGDNVHLRWQPQHAHLFDARTEARVA